MPSSFAILLQLLLLFGGEDPLAPIGRARWHHFDMTLDAAAQAGFAIGAAHDVAWHATAVDFYLYHPLWCLTGGRRRLVGASMARLTLDAVHFDDLGSTASIAALRQRITGGVLAGLLWAWKRRDGDAARHLIGVGLHAVQDFYSHSTWIDDVERRGVTWPEAGAKVAEMPLHTGAFAAPAGAEQYHGRTAVTPAVLSRLPAWLADAAAGHDISEVADEGCARPRADPRHGGGGARTAPRGLRFTAPGGINLDSIWQARVGVRQRGLHDLPGVEAFRVARDLAVRDSAHWLDRVGTWAVALDPAFWAAIRGEVTDAGRPGYGMPHRRRCRHQQFEDPAQLPYLVVATGAYPPTPAETDSWWLRVAITAHRRDRVAVHTAATEDQTSVQLRRRAPFDCGTGGSVVLGPFDTVPSTVEIHGRQASHLTIDAFTRSEHPKYRMLADVNKHRSGIVPLTGTARSDES